MTTVDTTPINWMTLAERLHNMRMHMAHHEDTGLSGLAFEAEALRRTFRFSANDGSDGRRPLPYETISAATGLMSIAEADHLRNMHTAVDRANRQEAEQDAVKARAETRRVLIDAARDLAGYLRQRCNDRTVPSRYRREGVLLAADWIDPDSAVKP